MRLLCPWWWWGQAWDADPWENGRCGAGWEGWAGRGAREQRGEVDQRVPGRQPGRAQAEDVGCRRWSRHGPGKRWPAQAWLRVQWRLFGGPGGPSSWPVPRISWLPGLWTVFPKGSPRLSRASRRLSRRSRGSHANIELIITRQNTEISWQL